MVSYILHFKPFEETLINRLEAMNDTVTLLLVDLMFMFTPIVDSNLFKYNLGFVFIALFAGCISVHLFFLFKDITLRTIQVLKTWRLKHIRSEKNAARQGADRQKGFSALMARFCAFIRQQASSQEDLQVQVDSTPPRMMQRTSNVSDLQIIEEVEEPENSSEISNIP